MKTQTARQYRKLIWVFPFLSLFSHGQVFSQSLPAPPDILTTNDGLCFRNVTAIAQDAEGLMWFGTGNGLDRFDGYRFLNFAEESNSSESFSAHDFLLKGTLTFKDSTLLTVADNRLYKINPENLEVQAVEGIDGKILQLRKGKNEAYWLVSEKGEQQFLWQFTPQNGFEKIDSVARLRREFTDLSIDTSGHVWWSSITQGIQHFDNEGQLLNEVKLDSFIWFGTKMHFTPLFVDSRNRIFVFPKSDFALWEYLPSTGEVKVWAEGFPSPIYEAFEDSEGNVWFATKQGLLQLGLDGTITDHTASVRQVLEFSAINVIFEDRTNVLWVGTDNGLLKFPVQKRLFGNHLTKGNFGWGNAMRGIAGSEYGQLLFFCEAGEYGLHHFEASTGQTSLLHSNLSAGERRKILENSMHLVFDQERNCAWMLNHNLLKIDLESKGITVIELPISTSPFNDYYPFELLPDGNLLFGNLFRELSLFNPDTGEKNLFLGSAERADLGQLRVKAVTHGKDGSIWIGTIEKGIFRFSAQGGLLQHFSTEKEPSLSNDHILCLLELDDWLWAGTFGGGLNGIHLPTGKVHVFKKQNGLADNHVVSILPENGQLWLATYDGLSCFDHEEISFQNFYVEDGLSHHEFNYASSFKGSDGRLYFGGMNGVNSFKPEDVLKQQPNPPLVLTGFTKYDHELDSLIETLPTKLPSPIVISPYVSYFQFEWTLPNYFRSDKNQYWTWLEGLEEGWGYLGNIPRIRFDGLPPGKYTLHIKGADSRGNPATKGLAIPILVKPVFYQRWWFILTSALILTGIVYAISRFRYRRKLEMEKIRTKIASDLHDEVGSMLSGLAMQAEILELTSETEDKSMLTYIKGVSRSAVGKMRDMVWSIDSRRDRMEDLLDRMREHAEETFPPLDIFHELKTGEMKVSQKLPVDVRQNLYLIYKEAVTNICKHSGADKVHIFIGNKNGKFEMSIKDNGTSFHKKEKHTGLGLSNMHMRAEAIKADFSTEHNDGFLIKIKFKKAL